MAGRPDVAIVGGGVIGCSIAYHLSVAGVRCCVLEKGSIGSEASRAAAGLLAPQSESIESADVRRLGWKSLGLFPSLAQELLDSIGIDVELVPSGILKLPTGSAEAEALQGKGHSSEGASLNLSWLTTQQLAELEPCLAHSQHGALLSSEESHINGLKLTEALARVASARGAKFLQGAEVTGFLRSGMRVSGVRTGDGDMEAAHVVLACGAWSGGVARSLGLELPVGPVRGQVLALQPAPGEKPLRHSVYHAGTYLVPKRDGSIWVGATVEEVGFHQQVTAEGVVSLLNFAIHTVPGLKEATFLRAWAGLRPGSPDNMPILGPAGEMEGLVLATGHFRNGILLAPITGKLIADYIVNDEVAPLRPFSLDRFVGH